MSLVKQSWALALIVWIVILPAGVQAENDEFAIGVPQFGDNINLLNEKSPAGILVRAAVLQGLTRRSASGKFLLDLSDSMSVSADRRRYSFRLRAAARFPNGNQVSGSDVLYSLERCRGGALSESIGEITLRSTAPAGERNEEWLDVEDRGVGKDGLPSLGVAIADCPILDRHSSEAFGPDLGYGTNLVSAAEFSIDSFRRGNILLRRAAETRKVGQSAQLVSVRGFDNDEHALAALRLGTIDAFFASGAELESKLAGDETLFQERCFGYSIVKRKGLNLECDGRINLAALSYAR